MIISANWFTVLTFTVYTDVYANPVAFAGDGREDRARFDARDAARGAFFAAAGVRARAPAAGAHRGHLRWRLSADGGRARRVGAARPGTHPGPRARNQHHRVGRQARRTGGPTRLARAISWDYSTKGHQAGVHVCLFRRKYWSRNDMLSLFLYMDSFGEDDMLRRMLFRCLNEMFLQLCNK